MRARHSCHLDRNARGKKILDADRKLGDALNVKGTPTIFINGREYDTKLSIDDWVDGEIAASGSTPR